MFKSNTSKLYKNKYILVTGAAGHIGSNLSKILIKKNFKVILIDNFSNSEKKTIQFLIKPYNKKAKQILKWNAKYTLKQSCMNQIKWLKKYYVN